jgi:pimeloyl-ACP methyl ester carboxylesterase
VEQTVHVYQGGLDRHVPPDMGRHIALTLPAARLHFFPDEGHLSILVNRFADCAAHLQDTSP